MRGRRLQVCLWPWVAPLSCAGFALNIGVMFFLNWMYALIGVSGRAVCRAFCDSSAGLSALTLVFIYLLVRAPAKNWGEISQALMFHQGG